MGLASLAASRYLEDISIMDIPTEYASHSFVTLFPGDCLRFLSTIPNGEAKLIVTSPPYNIGKKYEKKKILGEYIAEQEQTIDECVRLLSPQGSICWQVGNHVDGQEIYPIDILLYPVFKKKVC